MIGKNRRDLKVNNGCKMHEQSFKYLKFRNIIVAISIKLVKLYFKRVQRFAI